MTKHIHTTSIIITIFALTTTIVALKHSEADSYRNGQLNYSNMTVNGIIDTALSCDPVEGVSVVSWSRFDNGVTEYVKIPCDVLKREYATTTRTTKLNI